MLTRRSFLALLLAAPLMGQISLVNNNTAGSASPYSITSPTAGNVLLGCFINRGSGSATTLSSVTQTNVTWTFVQRSQFTTPPGVTAEIWWGKVNASPGTSITFSWASGSTTSGVQVTEFSGVDATSPVDGTAATNNGSSTTSSSGTYTSGNANDVLFFCAGSSGSTSPSAPTNSFNLLRGLGAGSGGTTRAVGDSYRIVSSATSYTTALTVGNNGWANVLVGFKGSANAIPNKIYSYLSGVSRAAFYTFAVASLGWDCRSVIARVREMLVQLKDAVEMALSRIAEMEMVNA
jgi:hypothetical protein